MSKRTKESLDSILHQINIAALGTIEGVLEDVIDEGESGETYRYAADDFRRFAETVRSIHAAKGNPPFPWPQDRAEMIAVWSRDRFHPVMVLLHCVIELARASRLAFIESCLAKL